MDQIKKLQTQIEAMRAELGGGEDVAGEVSSFLKGESVASLLEQPKQQRKQAAQLSQGNRPSLEQMLGEVKNGTAQFGMGHF